MAIFSHIKLKALFMLTVFTVNLYAVCHCHHKTVSQANAMAAGCSHCHKEDAPKQGKDGCCGTHAIQFAQLEKLAVKGFAIHAPAAQDLAPMPLLSFATSALASPSITPVRTGWQQKHAPPDLLSLHKCYRI